MRILAQLRAAKRRINEKARQGQILCFVKHRIKGLRPVSDF